MFIVVFLFFFYSVTKPLLNNRLSSTLFCILYLEKCIRSTRMEANSGFHGLGTFQGRKRNEFFFTEPNLKLRWFRVKTFFLFHQAHIPARNSSLPVCMALGGREQRRRRAVRKIRVECILSCDFALRSRRTFQKCFRKETHRLVFKCSVLALHSGLPVSKEHYKPLCCLIRATLEHEYRQNPSCSKSKTNQNANARMLNQD